MFAEGMFSVVSHELLPNAPSVEVPPQCTLDGSPTWQYNTLRFFDSCKAYTNYIDDEDALDALVDNTLSKLGVPPDDRPLKRGVLEQLLVPSSPLLVSRTGYSTCF